MVDSARYAGSVTLLNASYEPLGRVSFKQAMRMVARKVAAVEEAVEGRTVWLRTCPLLDAARTYPQVVCTVHRGLVEGLLDAAGEPPAGEADGVALDPFAEP